MDMGRFGKCHCFAPLPPEADPPPAGAMTGMRGFTFIELLIAISIFAVVAIALYSTFFAGITVWKRSGEGGNVYQNVRFVFDDITKDLKNAVYCTKEEESIFAFSGTTEEIVFFTSEPVFSEGDVYRKELVKVAYRFDRGEEQLIRASGGRSLGFDIEKGDKEVLLDGVKEVTFAYCYDTGDEDEPYLWKDEWVDEEMRIPRGVKLTSLIKTEKSEKEALKFTKIIFMPIGVLGEEGL